MNRNLKLSAGFVLAASIATPLSMFSQSKEVEKKYIPKAELFVGYSYLRAVPTYADGNRLVMLNGGSTSLAFNLNRHLGLVTDFGGFRDSDIQLSGPGAVPTRIVDSTGSVYTFLFGPRFSYRGNGRFTPFAQVLGGGAYATSVQLKNCTLAPCTPLPEQGSFAMTAGGGLDIKLSRHIALRAVQAEYLMTRFANVTTTTRQMQNDMRLSAGLVFRFGSHPAPMMQPNRSPLAVCSVDTPIVSMGSNTIVGVHGKTVDADNDALTYSWSASEGIVQGASEDVQWDMTGVSSGSHTIKLAVVDGHGGTGSCAAEVVIAPAPNHAPTVACSVLEPSLEAGQIAHITAVGTDVDGDPTEYTWTTSMGTLRGTGAATTLQTDTTTDSTYLVKVHVSDGRGGGADCSVGFSSHRSPEVIKLEDRLSLHSVYFPTAEPTVEQPGRGLLPSQHKTLLALSTDFSQYQKSRPEAHLILEGHADPRGSAEYNQKLSELRVELTKQYLIAHGISPDSIEIKARGAQQNLTDAQVREAISVTPELDADARKRLLLNMKTIILASNRRVDITLSTTNQHSIRQYPFNAADSMTLLSEQKPSARRTAKRANGK